MEKRYPVQPDTWNAIDDLGRALPAGDSVGAPREKFVGLFYWTWHNAPGGKAVNVSKIIRENPDGTISLTRCCEVAGVGGVGTNATRSGTFDYYINEKIRDNDPKGVGPFIWASLEYEALQDKK